MGYNKIVCGVTCSEASARAAAKAAGIAQEMGAELIFLNVADITFIKGSTISLQRTFAEDTLFNFGNQCLKFAGEIASALGVQARTVSRRGRIRDVIREVILEEKADLLVIGHEQRTFFERFIFNGEVEKHVARIKENIDIDVIVVE